MPKIHPETKVLIIKRLKTRSTAEVADTFNVSQRQVQRIRKRCEETGDVFDKPRSGRPRKTTAREDHLVVRILALVVRIRGDPQPCAMACLFVTDGMLSCSGGL